jgi:hypothetical protein
MLSFTATRSELFFARRVLPAEGPSDERAAERDPDYLDRRSRFPALALQALRRARANAVLSTAGSRLRA